MNLLLEFQATKGQANVHFLKYQRTIKYISDWKGVAAWNEVSHFVSIYDMLPAGMRQIVRFIITVTIKNVLNTEFGIDEKYGVILKYELQSRFSLAISFHIIFMSWNWKVYTSSMSGFFTLVSFWKRWMHPSSYFKSKSCLFLLSPFKKKERAIWYIQTHSVTTVKRNIQTLCQIMLTARITIIRCAKKTWTIQEISKTELVEGCWPSVSEQTVQTVNSHFSQHQTRSLRRAMADLGIPYTIRHNLMKNLVHMFAYEKTTVH